MTGRRRRIGFESARELLLVEVARRCRVCGEPARLGLTKAEARAYRGFECERCESWNDDGLAGQDVPEWWEELRRAAGPDSPHVAAAAAEVAGGAAVGTRPDGGRRRGLRLVGGGRGRGRAGGEDA